MGMGLDLRHGKRAGEVQDTWTGENDASHVPVCGWDAARSGSAFGKPAQ